MEEVFSVAAVGAKLLGIGVWQKTTGEQPQGVEFLNPLAVFDVGFFAFDVFGKLTIAEHHLKSMSNENGIQTLPIGTCTFHGYCFDVIVFQPSGDVKEVFIEHAKLPDVAFGLPHGHPVGATAYVNSGGKWMHHLHRDCFRRLLIFIVLHRNKD